MTEGYVKYARGSGKSTRILKNNIDKVIVYKIKDTKNR